MMQVFPAHPSPMKTTNNEMLVENKLVQEESAGIKRIQSARRALFPSSFQNSSFNFYFNPFIVNQKQA